MKGNNPSTFQVADGEMKVLKNTGMPLGLFDDQDWQQRKIQLDPGDLVAMYTDGVTDAQNPLNDLYGRDIRLPLGLFTRLLPKT